MCSVERSSEEDAMRKAEFAFEEPPPQAPFQHVNCIFEVR